MQVQEIALDRRDNVKINVQGQSDMPTMLLACNFLSCRFPPELGRSRASEGGSSRCSSFLLCLPILPVPLTGKDPR